MWVSGSLIRSSTWRSSSVSAPCISSFDLLAEFAERSRTMRGSFCQAIAERLHARLHDAFLQLGGDVESRCSGTLNSVSSLRREISRSWFAGQAPAPRPWSSENARGVDIDADRTGWRRGRLRRVGISGRLGGQPFWPQPCCRLLGIFLQAVLSAVLSVVLSSSWPRRPGLRVPPAARSGSRRCAGAVSWAGATSIEVSRNARSSSSSDTSPDATDAPGSAPPGCLRFAAGSAGGASAGTASATD